MTRPAWNMRKERGSPLLIRLMIWLSLRLRVAARLPAAVPDHALLLLLLTRRPRVLSPLSRARARPGGRVLDVLRHFFTFACVLMERVFCWRTARKFPYRGRRA